MIGTGYVGLVTGTCFAESGNYVTCIDIDAEKIARLKQNDLPIYEPGLGELVQRNQAQGRLHFTTSLADGLKKAHFVFIAVGTPQAEDGSADLSSLWSVVDRLAEVLEPSTVVVIKSTVPVGTNAAVAQRLAERTGRAVEVASNPEFLKEGAALDDFMRPDRVVVGVRNPAVAESLRELYKPFLRTERPFLVMSPESAEMTKYVANAMLATKISFINEIANLCERMEADINEVRRGIGHDERIGFAFLFPGLGYGGSCFPKDVRALQAMARNVGVEPRILAAVDCVNDHQKEVLMAKITQEYGEDLSGKRFAVWGLAFKPRTDDIREAPSVVMLELLLQRGAELSVHDPVAMTNIQKQFGDRLIYNAVPLDALRDADALVICTEWKEFQNPDFEAMRSLMRKPVVFDGRNLYELRTMRDAGFTYYSIGRATVRPQSEEA